MARTVDADRQRQVFERLEGVMDPEDTLRDLGIPHVKLTRSSRVYFPDEVVTWLRNRERSQ